MLANQVDLNRLQAFTSAVVEVRVHPDWNPNDITLGRGDVALMKLADDVPGVQPAPLHTPPVGFRTSMTLVGYGLMVARPTSADQLTGILRKGINTTFSCLSTGSAPNKPSDAKALCFASSSRPGGCAGDSGGPAYLQVGGEWRVAGVASGSRNASDFSCGEYTVYAAVAAHRQFIEDSLGSGAGDGGASAAGGGAAGGGAAGAGAAGQANDVPLERAGGCAISAGMGLAPLAAVLVSGRLTAARRRRASSKPR